MSTVDVGFNPFDPGFTENPYPHWATLREHDPVHETPLAFWLITRYEDVHRFVRDHSLSVEDRHARSSFADDLRKQVLGDRFDELMQRGTRAMLNLDPPDHTRLRRLVTKAFTPRVIEQLRPRIQELVDEALDAAESRGELELIGDVAFPLPFAVISEMLGMPDANRDEMREWSGTVVRSLEPLADPELIRAIADAGENIRAFTREAIEWKRRDPADDLLSALIAAEEGGDVLTDEELIDQVVLLYIAGHETTVNLIGNGMLALMRNRSELERLRQDPALEQNAIEEFLRYDPPVQMTRRITLQDVEVGGKTIPAGTFVACVIAAANRDPRHWGETADTLDIGRTGAEKHLAFGGGVHHCLGAALARLEGRVAIGTVVRRFPQLEMSGEPVWNGRMNLRGLDRLPLAIT